MDKLTASSLGWFKFFDVKIYRCLSNYNGFVNVIQNGKQRIYEIDKKTMLPLLKLIDKHVDTYYRHYCKFQGEEKNKRWESKR